MHQSAKYINTIASLGMWVHFLGTMFGVWVTRGDNLMMRFQEVEPRKGHKTAKECTDFVSGAIYIRLRGISEQ